MLAIGRALMTNPKLLILDEATEGLAPLVRAEIWACLKRLKSERQAILVIDKNVDALDALRRPARDHREGPRRLDRHERRAAPRPGRQGPLSARLSSHGEGPMKSETAGITRANEGLDGIVWNILGQTYVPKHRTEHSFSWHATFPPDTFVPPHIHPTQDEYLYILEGRLDFWLDGQDTFANPGDLVRLPKGKPHGIFNKSGAVAKCLFWVSPTGKLYDLFWGIHNMSPQTPDAVVALSAKHDVEFLPPA